MEVRGARSLREVNEAYDLAARVFGPNYFEAREVLAHVRALELLQDLEDAVVVVEGEKVLGFVRILDRKFYTPAGVAKAGGITAVCIHPELRGHGWGNRVMEGALRRCQQRGDTLSVLFARRAVDRWYPKLGYVGIGCHPEMKIEMPLMSNDLPHFAGGLQPGIIKASLDTYAKAYEDSYGTLFLSFYRDPDWWQCLPQRLWHRVEDSDFINVMMGGIPIGYFMLKSGRVIEAASLGRHRDFLAGLLQFHASRNDQSITLALPPAHWCVKGLRSMNHTLNVRHSWDGGHMVRILNKDLFEAMVLQNTRLEASPAVKSLFNQCDTTQHMSARKLLMSIIGVWPNFCSKAPPECPPLLNYPLLPNLPSWSIVDEL